MSRAARAVPQTPGSRTAHAIPPRDSAARGYFHRSELPLTSLVFLLPLIIIYEIGVRYVYSSEIIASRLLQDFFHVFGATGRSLPALAVVGILLTWHIARNDPWRLYPGTLLGMAVESLLLVLPVLAIYAACAHYVPLYAAHPALSAASSSTRGLMVLSLGAGIYEELVFRLIAFTLLDLILLDFLRLQRGVGMILIVVIPAVLFALYHYLGHESFQWQSFAFRSAAGIYFGGIFLLRGFGITAGSHAAYDLLVVCLTATAGR
jgi:hypothetical protein